VDDLSHAFIAENWNIPCPNAASPTLQMTKFFNFGNKVFQLLPSDRTRSHFPVMLYLLNPLEGAGMDKELLVLFGLV